LLPGRAEPLANLGAALTATGQMQEADQCLQDASRIDAVAIDRQARQLATHPSVNIRNGKLAVRLARAVCAVTVDQSAERWDTLAAAEAEAGNFTAAEAAAKKALALAASNPQLSARIGGHLRLFESHQPLRENPTGAPGG
jgi:hypothetical protein